MRRPVRKQTLISRKRKESKQLINKLNIFFSSVCAESKNGKIIISAVENHNYKLTLNGSIVRYFSVGITLAGFSPGTYDLCITVEGQVFEQCYKIIVEQGKVISGKSSVSGKTAFINIEEGTAPFTAFVNGKKVLETSLNDFNIEVVNGDVISVKSAIECEGVFENKLIYHAHSNFKKIIASS